MCVCVYVCVWASQLCLKYKVCGSFGQINISQNIQICHAFIYIYISIEIHVHKHKLYQKRKNYSVVSGVQWFVLIPLLSMQMKDKLLAY